MDWVNQYRVICIELMRNKLPEDISQWLKWLKTTTYKTQIVKLNSFQINKQFNRFKQHQKMFTEIQNFRKEIKSISLITQKNLQDIQLKMKQYKHQRSIQFNQIIKQQIKLQNQLKQISSQVFKQQYQSVQQLFDDPAVITAQIHKLGKGLGWRYADHLQFLSILTKYHYDLRNENMINHCILNLGFNREEVQQHLLKYQRYQVLTRKLLLEQQKKKLIFQYNQIKQQTRKQQRQKKLFQMDFIEKKTRKLNQIKKTENALKKEIIKKYKEEKLKQLPKPSLKSVNKYQSNNKFQKKSSLENRDFKTKTIDQELKKQQIKSKHPKLHNK